jgi:N-acyl-D-amino-acid deacylase
MRKRNVPGGALAVMKDGRLVYARGYGWACIESHIPVQPTSRFRIASISKTLTSAAVMTLVQQGKLSLDDSAFQLTGLQPLPGATVDPRLWRITIRQLLHHTGGFDRDKSFDPMFHPGLPISQIGFADSADQNTIIQHMIGRPLDFDPGTRYAYSNFGFCVLGRIIEHVSGQSYETYVRQHVLEPLGLTHMRLGRTRFPDAAPGEVCYYQPNQPWTPSIFPQDAGQSVPFPYGGFNLEAMDSHGGWLASAVDLVRFATHVDDPRFLQPAFDKELYARPAPPVGVEKDGKLSDWYYGLGWCVRPGGTDGKANYWHDGSLPGTYSLLVRRWDGLTWAVVFNQRSEGAMPSDDEIDSALHKAADAVKKWPDGELIVSEPSAPAK